MGRFNRERFNVRLIRNYVRSWDGSRQAPKGRQMMSPGREPRDRAEKKKEEPRSGDRYLARTAKAHAESPVCPYDEGGAGSGPRSVCPIKVALGRIAPRCLN